VLGGKLPSCAALAAFCVALLLAPGARALEVPELTGRVVDRADVLSPEAEARIGNLLEGYEKQTGQQFAVLTVPSLDGDAIEDFSIRVVDKWKLGKKGKDDGLLLLVVPKDKRVRIEVGRGLEGDVTDVASSRIIRNVIGPAFRSGDYAGGIERALNSLMRAASGKAPEGTEADQEPAPGANAPRGSAWWILILLLFAPVLLPLVFALRRRNGGIGGGRGMFMGGGWGGGGWGGGGFGGGGFGGGGFGGGGGGFGGGGSSGSW
jgi:uncharacterized protein